MPDMKIARLNQRELNDKSYSDEFPMLSVAPGDFVAIQYTENGHVSRAELSNPNKPVNRGTIYLYGTTQNDLSNYNLVDIHLTWTADGKGGDQKGKLLATRNYDDGQCHEAPPPGQIVEGITEYRQTQLNMTGGSGLSCQSDLQIPLKAPVGSNYTVIWVWDWPDMSKAGVAVPPASYHANSSNPSNPKEPYVTKPEIYTGVVDFAIVDPCNKILGDVKGPTCGSSNTIEKVVVHYAKQPIPKLAGIQAQLRESFLVKVPQAGVSVTAATANPSDIPVFGLIGQEPTRRTNVLEDWPLPASLFQHLDGPGAIGAPTTPGNPHPTDVQDAKPTSLSMLPSLGGHDRILTLTTTVPTTTVYVTETKTSTATTRLPSGTGNLALSPSQSVIIGAPSVSPFLRPRYVRREAGTWRS